MSFSNQQTPPYSNLTNPVYPTTFDRSILGILNDNDEFNRPLALFTDRSTGQPSVHSTSEESEAQCESPAYDPSQSSNNTSSRKVFTPQSVSDASGGLHPRIASSRSGGSSDGEYSDCSVVHGHSPSLSTHASADASQAAPSPIPSQMPIQLPLAGIFTPSPMSLAFDEPIPGPFGPLEHMTDPQATLTLTMDDLDYLQERMEEDDLNRVGTPAQISDRMDWMDSQVNQYATCCSESAQNPEPSGGNVLQRLGGNPFSLPIRTPRVPRSKAKQKRQQASNRNAVEKAKATEHSRLIRQIGSCLPCLVNHEQCDNGEPCPKCLNGQNSKIPKTPCIRPRLKEAVLCRTGALNFPEGPPEITNWISKRSIRVQLYNIGTASPSVSPELRPRLEVNCREFPNTPGIRSMKTWMKGTREIDIHLPNYAMSRRQRIGTAKKLDVLVDTGYKNLVGELAAGQDDIVSRTLAEAVRQAESCGPIKDALGLSVLSRLASKSFNIFGEESLGIAQEQDPESPYYKRIPIPPLLDAQLDFLLMEKMKGLKKSVLSGLRRMIAGQGRKHWFKIYLTISLLLLNLESVYQNQCRQMQRYSSQSQHQLRMLEYWENAAQNLIDHFRAVCRGHIPLNIEWTKAEQDAAKVDDQSLNFINHLREIAQSRVDYLREKSRASPDTPLVWVSALFIL